MHPVARVCQILFLLCGMVALVMAWMESVDNGFQAQNRFRYECTTENVGTTELPRPKEVCDSREGWQYLHDTTDEPLAAALTGLGLMIGAVAISVGGQRRTSARSTRPPVTMAPPVPAGHQPPPGPVGPQPPPGPVGPQPPAGPPRTF